MGRSPRSWPHWLLLASAAVAALLFSAACEREPTAPEESGELAAAAAAGGFAAGQAGSTAAAWHGQESTFTLEYLLRSALHKVRTEKGDSAARALKARLEALEAELRAAREAHDRERFERAQAALRAEQIKIVLEVLGNDVARQVVEGVSRALTEVRAQVAAARAAGKDVSKLDAGLARAAQVVDSASAALGRQQYDRALDLGTRAASLVSELRFAASVLDGSFIVIPALERLVAEAYHKVVKEQGRDSARALVAKLEQLQKELREAKQAHDRERAERLQAAIRAEQIRVAVAVLGAAAPAHVLEATVKVLEAVNTQIAALKAAGKDVKRLEEAAAKAAELIRQARTALESQKLPEALHLATQAGHLVDSLRRTLHHQK
ncbi:MAG: hypothetical protein HY703_03455 [Gemmatimonadetes bacterium]|nr:hypothetical protein [Gemmatimonadota bacterium]